MTCVLDLPCSRWLIAGTRVDRLGSPATLSAFAEFCIRFHRKSAALVIVALAGLVVAGEAAANDFDTPLHRVSADGNVEVARILLEGGAEVNATDMMGRTPLHLGAQYPDMVRLLLEHGARVDKRNAFRETPLHLAVPHTESVRLLVNAGANVAAEDAFGRTALDLAVDSLFFDEDAQTVTLLVEAGAAGR